MAWGKTMEPVIAKYFEKTRIDLRFENVNFILQHPDHKWALANLDGLLVNTVTGKDYVMEIKNVQQHVFDSWQGEIPIYYMMQVQHQLMVTGLDAAYFVVCVGGRTPLRSWLVPRDEEMIAHQITIGAAFWKMVEDGTPPPADQKDTEAIGQRYRKASADAPAVELEPDLVSEYKSASASLDIAEARMEAIKNKVKAAMQDRTLATVDGVKAFTWNESKGRETIDTKALAAAHPDIAKSFMKQHDGSRTLRFVYK